MWSFWRNIREANKNSLPAGTGPSGSHVEPFDEERLARLACIEDYSTRAPYPHLVLDDFFEPRALDRVLSEWPSAATPTIEAFDDGAHMTGKFASTWRTKLGPYTHFLLQRLAEPAFLETLEKVTGIVGLMPDPYLFGGGLHFTGVGGRLAIHADFNKHFRYRFNRRLNLLVYLNRGWTEENQGWLELWDRDMKTCVQRILPVFNRMVIFSTSSISFHGQPEPVKGPPTLLRKSIAVYYYSPLETTEDSEHSTLWQARPGAGY